MVATCKSYKIIINAVYLYLSRVLCAGVVYLIGGVLFMKFGKQASGADLMPNKQFWTGVPTNIKVLYIYVH